MAPRIMMLPPVPPLLNSEQSMLLSSYFCLLLLNCRLISNDANPDGADGAPGRKEDSRVYIPWGLG